MAKDMVTEMVRVVEFIRIRQRVELLAKQIETTTAQKAAAESSFRLEEATKLLVALAAMAENDVQEIVIRRLTRQLVGLGVKVRALSEKKRAKKKQPAI